MNQSILASTVRRVVVDSREQRPLIFADTPTIKRALPAGDYSLEGMETTIAIERKSLADWINTILRARRRFDAELKKLQQYSFAAVVIESSAIDILAGDYRSDVSPTSLLGMTLSYMQSYPPVQFIFAGDRPHAQMIVEVLLRLGGEKYGSVSSATTSGINIGNNINCN